VDAPATEITVQEIVDLCRAWEQRIDNLTYPYLVSAAGKENLGGGVYVGISCTLQNAKIAFEARAGPSFVQCNISGGNLVAVDDVGATLDPVQTTAYTQVVRTSSSSATLQEQEDIQYASYGGGVTVDTTSAYSGTDFPVGTPRQPVNNVSDAVSIAAARGFTRLYIIGDITLTTGDSLSAYEVVGESTNKTTITINSDADVSETEFSNATVQGTLDGDNVLTNCAVETLTFVEGLITQCILNGTITLSGADDAHFLDCWSGVPGASTPVIDMGGSGSRLGMRNYNGSITLQNKSGSEAVSIDMNSGQVILDNTVTNGAIVLRGVGIWTNEETYTGGATVTNQLLSGDAAVEMRKLLKNKQITDPATGKFKVYDDDGSSVLLEADIYEDAAGAEPYSSDSSGIERRERLESP
jgi:hypothetical protein